jgi:hypothetical protein
MNIIFQKKKLSFNDKKRVLTWKFFLSIVNEANFSMKNEGGKI